MWLTRVLASRLVVLVAQLLGAELDRRLQTPDRA